MWALRESRLLLFNAPGLDALTRVTSFFDGGVVCESVGSANASSFGQPSPWNVMENREFFIFSSVGPSCETMPNEKIFGYFSSNLRPNELFVSKPKTMPTADKTRTCKRALRWKWNGKEGEIKVINRCEIDDERWTTYGNCQYACIWIGRFFSRSYKYRCDRTTTERSDPRNGKHQPFTNSDLWMIGRRFCFGALYGNGSLNSFLRIPLSSSAWARP